MQRRVPEVFDNFINHVGPLVARIRCAILSTRSKSVAGASRGHLNSNCKTGFKPKPIEFQKPKAHQRARCTKLTRSHACGGTHHHLHADWPQPGPVLQAKRSARERKNDGRWVARRLKNKKKRWALGGKAPAVTCCIDQQLSKPITMFKVSRTLPMRACMTCYDSPSPCSCCHTHLVFAFMVAIETLI